MRYGLQLWATVRTEDTETKKNLVVEVQKAQNKLLRVLEKKRISDKIPARSMLESQKMLSVNQLAAQIKLTEVWKAKNTEEDPIRMKFRATNPIKTRGQKEEPQVEEQWRQAYHIRQSQHLWEMQLDCGTKRPQA